MGLFSRRRAPRADALHTGDPRFDDWEVVGEFDDLATARAWRQHLEEAGIEAALTADHEPDRLGGGQIYLQVPPGRWSEAEELLSNLGLD